MRTAVAAGCKTVILTNGCGGLREGCARAAGADQRPHQPHRHFADHRRELRRPHRPVLAPAARLCKEIDPSLEEGVYAQFPGPHYETPAEITMVRTLGADLVGMSTTLEAIAAREAGPRCWASRW
ncbi:hypothetical protein NKH77_22235 [Streptomyces sp. M19]